MLETWTSYRLSDFLLFSPDTYRRLFELMNQSVWPAQIAVVLAALAAVCLVARPTARSGRIVAALLAAAWAWVAWGFHLERYASINFVAPYFAVGFVLQALLLLGLTARGGFVVSDAHGLRRHAGVGLLAFAVFLQPLLGPAAGRAWAGIGLVGLDPDPTAVATLGVAILAARPMRWLLMPIPLLWCAVSGVTAWGLGTWEGLVMPVVAIIAWASPMVPPGRPGPAV